MSNEVGHVVSEVFLMMGQRKMEEIVISIPVIKNFGFHYVCQIISIINLFKLHDSIMFPCPV